MVLRKLSEEEKVLTKRGIKRLLSDVERFEFLLEYNLLMVEKGLHSNYVDKLREFKEQRKEILSDLEGVKKKIVVLRGHLKNGVEVKEEKKVGDVESVPAGVG